MSNFTKAMRRASRLTRLGKIAGATSLVRDVWSGAVAQNPVVKAAIKGKPAGVLDAVLREALAPLTVPRPKAPRAAPAPAARAGTAGAMGDPGDPDVDRTAQAPSRGARPAAADAADDRARPAAAGADDHGGAVLRGSHAFGGLIREYRLFVPTRVAHPAPLVVMLHGCTQTADDFAAGTQVDRWAAREGFVVLYPQQSRSANPSTCWNWFQPGDQHRDRGEAGLLAHLVETIAVANDIDRDRIHVAGLSAGGAMTAILAAEYPDVFASVCVHSGLPAGSARSIPDALTVMRRGAAPATASRTSSTRPVPMLVIQGAQDRTVHPSNADALVASVVGGNAKASGADSEDGVSAQGRRYTRSLHRLADDSIVVEHWTLHSAGHAWAGGSADGSYTEPREIDATREMLRFFRSHPRPAVP